MKSRLKSIEELIN